MEENKEYSKSDKILIVIAGFKDFLLKLTTVLVVFVLALVALMYTPLVSRLNIVGYNKLIPIEKVIDNLVSVKDSIDIKDEIIKHSRIEEKYDRYNYNLIIETIHKIDSLNKEVELWRAYSYNIMDIMNGKKAPIKADEVIGSERSKGDIRDIRSSLDSLLKSEVSTQLKDIDTKYISTERNRLFPPATGEVTAGFNYKKKHTGITLSITERSPIMAIDEGTIISTIWTSDEGYIIQIQHKNNLISTYKGLNSSLKEAGTRVAPREVIGYIGLNKEENLVVTEDSATVDDSNIELFFQLWENGNVIDPERYIIF